MLAPVLFSQLRELCLEMPRRTPFDVLRQFGRCQDRRRCQQQVNVIRRYRASHNYYFACGADLAYQVARTLCYPPAQYLLPIFGAPDQVVLQVEDRVRALSVFRHLSYSRGDQAA